MTAAHLAEEEVPDDVWARSVDFTSLDGFDRVGFGAVVPVFAVADYGGVDLEEGGDC